MWTAEGDCRMGERRWHEQEGPCAVGGVLMGQVCAELSLTSARSVKCISSASWTAPTRQ